MLHKSQGILEYSDYQNDIGFKLIVKIDPEISVFYRSLIPKYFCVKPQMYAPHISVVRKEHDLNMDYWKRYEGLSVNFEYDNYVHHDEVYWWLNVFSKDLERIRVQLGLPVSSPYTRPPDGFDKAFHITLGNCKK